MKIRSTFFFVCLTLSVTAQEIASKGLVHLAHKNNFETSVNFTVKNANEAIQYLKNTGRISSDHELVLVSEINGLKGIHYTFIETFTGFEIRNAFVKVNTNFEGNILHQFIPELNFSTLKSKQANPLLLSKAENQIKGEVKETKLRWVLIDKHYHLCYNLKFLDTLGNYHETVLDPDFNKIIDRSLNNHFTEVDTVAKGLVFLPNPLVSAETTYGGAYVDNNDLTSPELDAERDTIDLELSFDNGTFYLENEHVKIVNISPPNTLPAESNNPTFYFNRSENGFEDVNAFHHLTTYQYYLQQLGFTNLVNYRIDVDCHGLNGADNSLFNYGTNPPSIVFGEGGVDDAEDVDVVIHEYTHAIMESASPNTNFGTERGAIDEAFGDYLAVSYSKTISSFQDNWVYRWDGHNEFWDGREVVSQKMYPDDLQFHIYADAPLWSAALMQIERNLGRDLTTTIALESAYSYTANMEMWQAAEIFLTTDDQLNNGVNKNTMCWIFKDRGMMDQCPGNRPNNLVSLEKMETNSTISIINTDAFYSGSGNLIINSSLPFDFFIYNLAGNLVQSASITKTYTELSPEPFQSGAYVLKVINHQETKTIKLVHE